MARDQTEAHYTRLHSLETPASRLIRDAIWGREADIGQQSFITPRYLDVLIARLGLGADNRVLDLGCGVGGPAVYLARHSGAHVTGVDLVEKGISVARDLAREAALGARTRFMVDDALALSFDDGAFDTAISLNVMNVFADKLAVLRELHRVLAPGGRLALLSGTFEIADDPTAQSALTREGTVVVHFDSIGEYRRMIEAAGFVIEEITEYVDDFRAQIALWRDAHRTHAEAIEQEHGSDHLRRQHGYFDTYLRLVEEGRASNHLVIATKGGI